MARLGAFGPLVGYTSADVGASGFSAGTSGAPMPRNSHDGTGLGFALRSFANDTLSPRYGDNGVTQLAKSAIYTRFWMRIRRYPRAVPADLIGECSFFGWGGNMQGGPMATLYLTPGGQVRVMNEGNALVANYQSLYLSPSVPLDEWFKYEVAVLPSHNAGVIKLRVSREDGTYLFDAGTLTSTMTDEGINAWNGVSSQQVVITTFGRHVGSTNLGCDLDISHGAWDDADFPVDSRMTLVPVVGAGTYNLWTGGRPDWQARNMQSTSGGSEQVSTTLAADFNNRQSYTLKNLRECGITGNIYHWRIALNNTAGGGGGSIRYFIRINGTDYETSTLNTSGSALNWQSWSFPGVTITPDDVLEIGVAGGSAGTMGMGGMCLLVDHDSPITEFAGGDFEIQNVSWVGTGGAGQSVALPFIPHMLLWWPRTDVTIGSGSYPPGGMWWDTLLGCHDNTSPGPRRDQIRVFEDREAQTAYLSIVGNYSHMNASGITYDCLCVRDPQNRIHARGNIAQRDQVIPVNTDSADYPINAGTSTPELFSVFAPEAMFLYGESDNTSLTAYFRGLKQSGDSTMPWGPSAAVTNVIQALTSSGWQAGTGAYQLNQLHGVFIGFRTNSFQTSSPFAITFYQGDASGSGLAPDAARTIPLALGGKVPEWVIIFPGTGNARYMKNAFHTGKLVSSYSESNKDSAEILNAAAFTRTAQTFQTSNPGGSVKNIKFYLKKTGAPTGTMRAKVWLTTGAGTAPSGALQIALSATVDVSTLSDSAFALVDFTFPSDEKPILASNTWHAAVLEYLGGDASNYVEVGQDASAPSHGGQKYNWNGAVWALDTEDLCFYVYLESARSWTQSADATNAIVDLVADGVVVNNAMNDGVLQGSYAESNFLASTENLDGSPTATAQTFTSVSSGELASAMFYLKKTGVPLGTYVAKLYATAAGVPTGAAIATSDAQLAGDLDNVNFAMIRLPFTGVNRVTLAAATVYAISIEYTGTASDHIDVAQDATAPTHAGTKYNFTGAWASDTPDLIFYVFTASLTWYTALAWTTGLDSLGVLPDGLWHKFLVAGHACKSIDSWYVGGIRQPTFSAEGDPDTEAYFLIPGYSAYNNAFGTNVTTETINGRLYTVVYVKEGGNSPIDVEGIRNGSTPFSLNVQGIEDVGNGTGTVISRSFDIYKHAMQNWVFGDYQSGAWLSTPTFPDSEGVLLMREESFSDASTLSARRIGGGYVGAGGFGLDGNFVSVREAVRLLNVSCDCDSGLNRLCQFFVSMTDDSLAVLTSSPEFVDVDDIKFGSFAVDDDFSNHFNVVPYAYAKDYVSGSQTPWRGTAEARDQASIDGYEDTLTMPTQELGFVRDQITASDIAHRRLLRHKDPPRRVQFTTPVQGYNAELGDVRLLSHYEGIGASGWSRQPLRVHRHTANLNDDTVQFECYDLSRLFETAFILGNEGTLNPSWAAAPALDRVYGYLADEVTEVFSDGEPGKRVR